MNTPTGWKLADNKLVCTFEFDTFDQAIDFIDKVAVIAQKLNHHPEITNMYTKVTLKLSTHDAGDMVTEKDIELAEEINEL